MEVFVWQAQQDGGPQSGAKMCVGQGFKSLMRCRLRYGQEYEVQYEDGVFWKRDVTYGDVSSGNLVFEELGATQI